MNTRETIREEEQIPIDEDLTAALALAPLLVVAKRGDKLRIAKSLGTDIGVFFMIHPLAVTVIIYIVLKLN